MKNVCTFLFLLLFASTVPAQKVDLDGEPIPVHYLRLPDQPLPASYQFYSVIVSSRPGDLAAFGLTEATLLKYAKVPGYKRIEKGGNFNIEISLADFQYVGSPELKTESSTTKDKSGKETTTYTFYVTSKYKQMLTLRVRNEDDKKLQDRTWLEFDREYKSEKYGNRKEAEAFLKDGLRVAVAKKVQGEILAAMSEIQALLAEKYGYPEVKQQVKLEILDSEKHPDYANFQNAYTVAKSAFGAMTAATPLDSIKIMATPAINFFDRQKDQYDAGEKSGKKLKYACLYDLALMHFWLENFDQATTYANAVIANDYEPKSGKRLLEDIEELKASMQKCGHPSRHFPTQMEVDSAKLESVAGTSYDSDKSLRVEAYKDQKKNVSSSTVEVPGVIYYKDGQESHGTFLLDGPQRVFEDKANTRFSVETAENAYVSVPRYDKVSRFTMGDRQFRMVAFKSANTASLGGKADMQIMEVLYESPKIVAYLAYTGDARGLNNPAEYVILNVAENDMTSLNSMKFALNLNKGIGKVYGDCPAVREVLDKDGFKRAPESIANLAKLIETCLK